MSCSKTHRMNVVGPGGANRPGPSCAIVIEPFAPAGPLLAGSATSGRAKTALAKAVAFFGRQVSTNGGYLRRYNGDLSLREGQGGAPATAAWVQPTGTPTVGQALLDACEATGEPVHFGAAMDAPPASLRPLRRFDKAIGLKLAPVCLAPSGQMATPKDIPGAARTRAATARAGKKLRR